MSSSESPGASLDDDLAAAFDSEFAEDDIEQAEEDVVKLTTEDGEKGNSASSSDVDLDELGDQGFTEVETLQEEAGFQPPPPKRQRIVRFADMDNKASAGSKSASGRAATAAAATAATGTATACAHPVWVFGLCGVCGISKETAAAAVAEEAVAVNSETERYGPYMGGGGGGSSRMRSYSSAGGFVGGSQIHAQTGVLRLKHLHAKMEVEVSNDEAERIRRDTVSRLLNRKRLILILDLDHTLLNSVHVGEIGEETAPQLAEVLRREEANLGPRRQLHRLAENKLWTKLRPGVFEFLEALRESYEMHIYTMGDKTYAAEVRKLLDPTGRLFSSVIAKDHSTTTTAKDLDVLLSADELALVLDDTEIVWPGHRRNLLQIERYHYFPSDLRKWRADGTALLEQGVDESATNGALATYMRVLRTVHARFFSEDDSSLGPLELRDVRDILSEQRRKILQGCSVVFSRCWPQDRDPHREPLWQLAESLGANCLPAYDPWVTTHVIAAVGGTEKVNQALTHGKAVVLPSWLQGCSYRWERLPEANFAVSPKRFSGDGLNTNTLNSAGPDHTTKKSSHGNPCGDVGGSCSAGNGNGVGKSHLKPEDELRIVMAVAGGGGGSSGGNTGGSGGPRSC